DSSLWMERLAPTDEATIPLDPIDAAAALDKALVSRPELEIARASIERRRAESAFATDTVRPALDAVVSYDRFGLAGMQNPDGSFVFGLSGQIPGKLEGGLGSSYSTLADGDFEDTRVGLVFSLPLGNRVARSVAAAARLAVEQSEEGLAGVRKAIRAEVLDAAAAMETSGQRIDASRSAREAAEVQLSAEKDRYAVGLSTNFLVLTRQNDLSRARLAEIEALTDYRTARAELARSTGSLLDERRIELEAPSSGNGSR
ncbi:MAG TPA: TolC family protein, partial [Patescibacteria group bacterium]|nr:TolC family protein [Patescibacteria group bacterium]